MNNENQKDSSLILSNNPNYQDNHPILKKEIIYDIDKEQYYLYNKENSKIIPINCFGKKIPKNK